MNIIHIPFINKQYLIKRIEFMEHNYGFVEKDRENEIIRLMKSIEYNVKYSINKYVVDINTLKSRINSKMNKEIYTIDNNLYLNNPSNMDLNNLQDINTPDIMVELFQLKKYICENVVDNISLVSLLNKTKNDIVNAILSIVKNLDEADDMIDASTKIFINEEIELVEDVPLLILPRYVDDGKIKLEDLYMV